jgi:hypothetical protein
MKYVTMLWGPGLSTSRDERSRQFVRFMCGRRTPLLYLTVARLLRALEATETMSRDHLEVIRLTEELEALWCLLRLILPAQILGSIILPKEVVHSIDGIEYGSHIYRRSACIESLGH